MLKQNRHYLHLHVNTCASENTHVKNFPINLAAEG